jgi:Transposase family tnp2
MFAPTVVLTAMLLLSLKYIYNLPRRSIDGFFTAFRRHLPSYGVSHTIVDQMATDARTYEKVLGLESNEVSYAVCRRCCSMYPLDDINQPTVLKCTSKPSVSGQPCGFGLYKRRKGKSKPKMVLRRRPLDDWLGQFLNRPGIIEKVDRVWERAQTQLQDSASDFWDGTFVREMRGPDGGKVTNFQEGETRLMFQLSVDWFNPFHNKISGKVASTGVVVMSCLNLPPSERYLEENLYVVALLPGREQGPDINPSLKPLVDDLLRYWHKGVTFIGIPSTKAAILVRCALVQLVCDLPAARKVAGFLHHSATHPCSICLTTKKDILHVDPLLQREFFDHMANALQYKDRLTKHGTKAAEKLLEGKNPHAVRWSVLNDLPYWDPIKCTVLDVMHLVLLGLCQFHWRTFWHCDALSKKNEPKSNNTKADSVTGDPTERDALVNQAVHELNPDGEEYDNNAESQGTKRGNTEQIQSDVVMTGTLQSNKTLSAEKLNAARAVWASHNDNALAKLNIEQILCLLRENHGEIPVAYKLKPELVTILVVGTNQIPVFIG